MDQRHFNPCRFLLVAAACAAPVPSANAADATGFYLGAGGGVTNYNIDYGAQVRAAYQPPRYSVDYADFGSSQKGGFKVFGGYQFKAPIALEVGYVNLGRPTAKYAVRQPLSFNPNPDVRDAQYDIQGVNFSAVGTLPINDAFSFHAMVGAIYSQYKYSETGVTAAGDSYSFNASNLWQTNFSFGAGATWNFDRQWSVRADWDRFQNVGHTFALNTSGNGEFSGIDLFSLNVVYRF